MANLVRARWYGTDIAAASQSAVGRYTACAVADLLAAGRLQSASSGPAERSASRAQQPNAAGGTAVLAIPGFADFRLTREVHVGGIDNTIKCCHHVQQ